MKNRWLITAFSFLLLLIAVSCGSRQDVQPRYRMELNKTLAYKLSGMVDLNVDAGFLQYKGKVGLTADVEMTAVDTNSDGSGYKILIDIKNPALNSGNQQLAAFFTIGVNYFKTWLSTIRLSDRGKVTVLYGTNVVVGFNSYTQLLFPDFSEMDNIWVGNTETTNYPAKFQDQLMTVVYTRMWKISKMEGFDLIVDSKYEFKTYDQNDYLKSVEPQPTGNLTLSINDVFSLLSGKMTRKNGKLQFNMGLLLKQDILSYMISVQGGGDIAMTLIDNPS